MNPQIKIVSFNVNGLRSRLHQLKELIALHAPEIIGLQETKVQDDDFPVAPLDADIGIGADNARRWLATGKTSFLPEERVWFRELLDFGLQDGFRALHPEIDDRFSWFDYRSRGFEADPKRGLRIDHLLLSRPLMERCRSAGIDYAIRALERPSDHCPVWVELSSEQNPS